MKIPVLLMNPAPSGRRKKPKMARKRTRRGRTSTRRRAPARRSTSTRSRRSIRRRRNPSLQVKPILFGAAGGAGIAAVAYAMDGLPQLSNRNRALALLGTGIVGGLLVGMYSPTIGAAVAAGGIAIGGHQLIGTLSAGQAPEEPAATTDGLGALRSQLGALRAQLGAVRGELAAAYDPSGVEYPAGLGAVREYDYAIG
jgi:hypothetical protein